MVGRSMLTRVTLTCLKYGKEKYVSKGDIGVVKVWKGGVC